MFNCLCAPRGQSVQPSITNINLIRNNVSISSFSVLAHNERQRQKMTGSVMILLQHKYVQI